MQEQQNTHAVATVQPRAVGGLTDYALSASECLRQATLIQQVMREVMRDGSHYGVVPGTQGKKTLLKPGAEKLCFVFGLSNKLDIRITDLGNQHREITVICDLYDRAGNLRGQGVGSASTMESKHRYRGAAGKTCPACGAQACKPGKKEYGGGYYCDSKAGGCNARFKGGSAESKALDALPSMRAENPDPADQYNCVTPDTRILTHDLRWIKAGEIKTGDTLLGVDENMSSEYARHFAVGHATVMGRRIDDLFDVEFDDGRTVRCNGEHKWLVKKVGLKGTEWVSTRAMIAEMSKPTGRPRKWSVMSVCVPWSEDTSRDAGYMAGLLDADGSLGVGQILVLFSQQQNIVLDAMKELLKVRGFKIGVSACKTQAQIDKTKSGKQVYGIRLLGGLDEQMRLLGTIRPPRLLSRWTTLVDVESRRLEGKGSGAGRPVQIASITPAGRGEIVLLGSSCRTYIAEGMVCHNTVLKMAKKRALVDAVLTATAASDIFDQDLEDLEERAERVAEAESATVAPVAAAAPADEPVRRTVVKEAAPAAQPKPAAHPAIEAARALFRTCERAQAGSGKPIMDDLCRLYGASIPTEVAADKLDSMGALIARLAGLAEDPPALMDELGRMLLEQAGQMEGGEA